MDESPYSIPEVATTYRRTAAPIQFAPPAADLVTMIEPPLGGRLLDVGTGVGVAAKPASRLVGPTGLVVGIDASIEMLRAGRDRLTTVVARTPGLPFRHDAFDRVIASFVVSHFEDYGAGLADMVRVCRSEGRVGMTAWGGGSNPVGQLWRD